LPAISASESMGKLAFIPATVGFWAGILDILQVQKLYNIQLINEMESAE
jgi:ZIP family zinc transporter